MMRLRSSQTLVFSQSEGALVACNFLTKSVFQCSQDLLSLLAKLKDWKDVDEISELVPEFEIEELKSTLINLQNVSAIVAEGSVAAQRETEFEKCWAWGIPTALMHYAVQDNDYIPLDTAQTMQLEKLETHGRVDLFLQNHDFENVMVLPKSNNSTALLKLMAKRRTVRQAKPEPVGLQQLSDCLFAGLGITGETQNCAGKLPLSMTPSGGARNPYEAYVFANNVKGLRPGIYHYSATEHSLGLVKATNDMKISSLIGGQEWGDDKACLIVLCAHLDRTMWKYVDANAYRVVLIEAGHIGQNIMLAATDNGLTACPTAAISHSVVKSQLGLSSLTQAPIYALTLSVPDLPH